jgi:hypothetical protein
LEGGYNIKNDNVNRDTRPEEPCALCGFVKSQHGGIGTHHYHPPIAEASEDTDKFNCGKEHLWISGKFVHINNDGILQVVNSDHYYHPEKAVYYYTKE